MMNGKNCIFKGEIVSSLPIPKQVTVKRFTMIRIINRYQSIFLNEQNEKSSYHTKNTREGSRLEDRLEGAPYHSKFMRSYRPQKILPQNSGTILSDYETVLTEKKVYHPININDQIV